VSNRILFHGISHRFGRRPLLDSVSLALEPGRTLLLAGANGSGKTTLMRIMAGLLGPAGGRIVIDDHIMPWRTARKHLLARTVYLHQEPYMFDASVADNLSYPLRTRGDRDWRRRTAEALELAHLEAMASQSAKTLSGGERRRLAIVRAWLRGVDFMLLDEPTANLDSATRCQALALMRDLHDAGVGLVLTCHVPEEIGGFTDDTLVLQVAGSAGADSNNVERKQHP